MSDDPRLDMAWRTGRKVGRTIYAQLGPEPSDHDPLIGCMDTPEFAADAVDAHNQMLDLGLRGASEAMDRSDEAIATYDAWAANMRGHSA